MTTHRTDYNPILGDAPEIQRLFGGRVRVIVRCLFTDRITGWYASNIGSRWGDFGSLMDAEIFVDGESKGWGSLEGLAYDDARLIGMEAKYLTSGEYITEFTYETLTDAYVQETAEKIDYELNGLRRITRTLIAIENTDYTKQVGVDSLSHTALGMGTETLYLASISEVAKDPDEAGFTRIQEVWLQPGVIREATRLNEDGTKEVSITSWYDKPTPAGIVTDTINDNVEGFDVWTVAAIQSWAGGDPTVGTALTYEAYSNFQYPGIAQAKVDVVGGSPAYNTDLSPPVAPPNGVLSTVEVSFQTSGTIGTLPYTLWNPSQWATMNATWLTLRGGTVNEPTSRNQGLVGYRTGTTDTLTYNGASTQAAFFNQFTYGGTITISGGPENPVGNTYVIQRPTLEVAFVGEDGTQYYRKTIIYATIPAQ